ncbi:MAG: methyltransferase domain-containing protein [Methylococcales bacterium]
MLYTIPAAPARGKTLELLVADPSVLTESPWLGRPIETYAIGFPSQPHARSAKGGLTLPNATGPGVGLPFPDNSFDILVLHETLDELAALARRRGAEFSIPAFLSEIARVLAPQGVIAGCTGNRFSVKRIGQRLKSGLGNTHRSGAGALPPLSVVAIHKALAAAGFTGTRIYSVEPGAARPVTLHEIELGWSIRATLWYVRKTRTHISKIGYWLRWLFAGLGLSQHFCSTIYFWAKKC